MKSYKYKARDKTGKLKEGIVRADSPQLAAQHFKELGMVLIALKEKHTGGSFLEKFRLYRRVKFSEIMLFTRQMYALSMAGLPLVNGLKSLEHTTRNRNFKLIIEEVRRDIESGSSFSFALSKFPQIFDPIYCSTVKAGEASGSLPEVLNRLSFSLEKQQETRTRIKQALSYPLIVITVIIIALLTLGIFVLPRFVSLFNSFGVDLPIFTRILIKANFLFSHYWYIFLFFVVILCYIFRTVIRTPAGKNFFDRFVLNIYIFGPLYLKIYMSAFARTIATLVKSGVPIVETLDLSGRTTNNIILFKAVDNMKEKVREGKSIGTAMREEAVFPNMVVQMISSGEESGRLDELMEMVADFYEREADYTIKNLTLLLEPLLLLIIAAVVLVLALGIFLPLWSLSGAIRM